jgi:hypothetical protein
MVISGYPKLRQLGRELRREGVAFFDMTQVFKKNEEDLYMDACCHFNRRGNVILARAMLHRIGGYGKATNSP